MDFSNLYLYAIIDLAIIFAAITMNFRSVNYFHPLSWYLAFHITAISWRIFELMNGKYPMYLTDISSGALYLTPIGAEEIYRAIGFADAALLIFALVAKVMDSDRVKSATNVRIGGPASQTVGLPFHVVMLFCGMMGLGIFLANRFEVDLESISYIKPMMIWPGVVGCIYIALYGARKVIVIPMVAVMALAATQGYHRFMFLLPVIFLVGIHVYRRRANWPAPIFWAFFLFLAGLFPFIKGIGLYLNDRGDGSADSLDMIFGAYSNPNFSQTGMFLDQLAGALTNADLLPSFLHGWTWLAVLTLPIPRGLWEDKPSLGGTAAAIASDDRPYDVEGRIVTMIGDFYINFGYVGVVVGFIAVAAVLCWIYNRSFRAKVLSFGDITYIALVTSLIQIYRDGINSIALFFFIAYFPLFIARFVDGQLRSTAARLFGERAPALQRR